jgi:ATP-dependent Clp protease ATP-binding subunit ClpA
MYERFTDRARKVMQLANQEAQRLNHEYIGTEHILLGLVKEGSGNGANVLKGLDVDLRKIRLEIEKIVEIGPDMVTLGRLPQTPRAKKVITYTMEEARALGHDHVGTEHIVLGLLREQEGVAAQVLTNFGLTIENVRRATKRLETPMLNAFCADWTEEQRLGQATHILDRGSQVTQLIRILVRRQYCHPLLYGPRGVGKEGIVRGLCQRIVEGKAPSALLSMRVLRLDVNTLVSGTSRDASSYVSSLIAEAARVTSITLVLDGRSWLQLGEDPWSAARPALSLIIDAANKRVLHFITLMTDDTFQSRPTFVNAMLGVSTVVKVEPPPEETARNILISCRPMWQAHHNVQIEDSAINRAISLTCERVAGPFTLGIPIELIDAACAAQAADAGRKDEERARIAADAIEDAFGELVGTRWEQLRNDPQETFDLSQSRGVLRASGESDRQISQNDSFSPIQRDESAMHGGNPAQRPIDDTDREAARSALARNWPNLEASSDKYATLLQALANFHRFGPESFELRYQLRSPKNRVEEWNRQLMHGEITEEELGNRLKADAERPIDLEMLTAFTDAYQERIAHYSRTIQEAIPHSPPGERSAWRKQERSVDNQIAALTKNFPLWNENIETVFNFLDEMRVAAGESLVKIGELEALSAHWLAELVITRTVEAWRKCKEIAKRSRRDRGYAYGNTAAALFSSTWVPTLPSPQTLSERLRQEFIMARVALSQAGRTPPVTAVDARLTRKQRQLTEILQMTDSADAQEPPKTFISYSWDSSEHKQWTLELATRLRADGIDVTLDKWSLVPGDQLTKFMETAIRDNSYVVIICTPNYKAKSDKRTGGVGYEGDIMTAEVLTKRNDRKFIAALRSGGWDAAMPSWLKGKYSIDLSEDPYSDEQYHDLLVTLHNKREQAPPIGKAPHLHRSIRDDARKFSPSREAAEADFGPIKIEGVLIDEAGRPTNDGTAGSALYAIPFKLNRAPTHEWCDLFRQTWDNPPRFSSRHRPGIAQVQGDRIVLTSTTIEEVRDVHRATLALVVETVNDQIGQLVRRRNAARLSDEEQEQQHRENLRNIADDIKFD